MTINKDYLRTNEVCRQWMVPNYSIFNISMHHEHIRRKPKSFLRKLINKIKCIIE